MRVSQVELYNEELKDLLSPDDDLRKLKIFDDPMHKGCVIQNVEEVLVTNAADVIRIMQTGSIKRRIAVTQLNHNSRCVRLPEGRVDHGLFLLWLTHRCSAARGNALPLVVFFVRGGDTRVLVARTASRQSPST